MTLNPAQVDRAVGTLVGAAAGDALGAGYEFGSARLDGAPGMIGGGLGNFAPGEWTDDTAQTYAIAEVAATGADLRSTTALDAIGGRFADWYAEGPPDVGVMTAQVLSAAGRRPDTAALRAAAERVHASSGRTGGNGTLMRTAPVALAHLHDSEALIEAATAVAALTHHDPIGGEACALWCLGIRHAVLTGELPDLVGLVDHLPTDRQTFWREAVRQAEAEEPRSFASNGYVVTALQAAWSAIVHTPVPTEAPVDDSFAGRHLADALGSAIAIGHDTDTVASIAGAMLGARWGLLAISQEWRRLLHGWPGRTGEDLAHLAARTVDDGRQEDR
ncbi:ADP-ribosylglycohydrolase family protein [Propionibacteriaceae bacterium Y1685]